MGPGGPPKTRSDLIKQNDDVNGVNGVNHDAKDVRNDDSSVVERRRNNPSVKKFQKSSDEIQNSGASKLPINTTDGRTTGNSETSPSNNVSSSEGVAHAGRGNETGSRNRELVADCGGHGDAGISGRGGGGVRGASSREFADGSTSFLAPLHASPGKGSVAKVLVAVVVVAVAVALAALRGSTKLYTKDELLLCDGSSPEPTRAVLLAIGGQVYDVRKGAEKYEGAYGAFLGRDASRAFVTGDFKEDLTDDVADLDDEALVQIQEWQAFYDKKYVYCGRLIGRFFDAQGLPTPLRRRATAAAADALKAAAAAASSGSESSEILCSSKWQQGVGAEVWCDNGFTPRKIQIQDPTHRELSARGVSSSSTSSSSSSRGRGQHVRGGGGGGKGEDITTPRTRCVCVAAEAWAAGMETYPGCDRTASRCKISVF